MNFLLGFISEIWREQMEFEVRRQSVRGSLLALKAVLGSTRRVILFSLYVLVFLYSLFGLLTVVITAPDLSEETKPIVIYGLLALGFGGLLVYNLREETWIKRWGVRERIEALKAQSDNRGSLEPELPPEQLVTQQMQSLLAKFEDRMEARLDAFEKRQIRRFERAIPKRPSVRGNSTSQDMALY